jgi:hypothetical protein
MLVTLLASAATAVRWSAARPIHWDQAGRSTVYRGTVFDLPIRVDSTFSGKEVYSYALQLQFDPRTLSLIPS